MADDKLVFPIGFDTQSGKDDAKRDTREVLEELQKLVDKHPLKVKMEISKEDRSSMRDFADILRKMSENAKKGAKDISSFKAKMAELNKQWDKLTASQRAGAEGNALRQQYRDLAREAGGYTSTLQSSVKAEDKSNQALEKKRQKLIAANAEYQKQDGYVKRLITRLGLYSAIFAGVRFAKQIRETTAEFELQRVSLGALIQDTEKAEQLFSQIKAAAVKSPFEIKDLVSYTKQLAAYKIEANELFDTMMRLSDISAGLGADMSRIVLAYGQIKGAGVLKGTELRQITELGIPMVDLLAKKLTDLRGELVTTGDVFKLISEKAISFTTVKEIFDDMTNAGGMFYKMQEKQSETLAGKWSNLKDSISIAYDEMGNTKLASGAMNAMIAILKGMADHWKVVYDLVAGVSGALITYIAASKAATVATTALTIRQAYENALLKSNTVWMPKFVAGLMSEAKAKAVAEAMSRRLIKARVAEATATGMVSKALARLRVALLSNPYAIAIAAIVGISAAIFNFVKHAKTAKDRAEELNESVAKLQNTKDSVEPLIKQYEELSRKTERTAAEQKRLDSIMKTLAEKYPSATKSVEDYGNKVEIAAEKVKALYEAEINAQKNLLQKKLDKDQKKLDGLNETYTNIIDKINSGQKEVYKVFSGKFITEPLTDEEIAKLTERRFKIEDEIKELEGAIKNAMAAIADVSGEGAKETDKNWNHIQTAISKFYTTLKNSAGEPIRLFQNDEIDAMSSQADAIAKAVDIYKERDEKIKTLTASLKNLTPEEREETEESIKTSQAYKDAAYAVLEYFNALDKLSSDSKSTKATDNRLQMLQEEVKLLEQVYAKFKEYQRYMSSNKAIEKTRQYFGDTISSLRFGPAFDSKTMVEFLRKYQDAMKSLPKSEKAVLEVGFKADNISWDEFKQNIKRNIEQISEEISKSRAAQDFFNNILGLTGDRELSANLTMSVYGVDSPQGDLGEMFAKTIAKDLQKQIQQYIGDVDISGAINKQTEEIDPIKLSKIVEGLDPDAIGEENFKAAKELINEMIKGNAEYVKSLYESSNKFIDFEHRKTIVAQREAEARKKIAESEVIPEEEKKKLTEASYKRERTETLKIDIEEFKAGGDYVKVFEDIDNLSTKTMQRLMSMLDEFMKKNASVLAENPEQMKTLMTEYNKLYEGMIARNPFGAIVDGLKEYRSSTAKVIEARRNLNKVEDEGDTKKTAQAQKNLADALDEQRAALKKTQKGFSGASNAISQMGSVLNNVVELFGVAEDSELGAFINGLVKSFSVMAGVLSTIAAIIEIIDTLAAPLLIAAAAIAAIGAAVSFFAGQKARRANKEIERLSRLIDDLGYAYERLEKAQETALGGEYISNYQQRMKTLLAEQNAYLKQAELERSKGKKTDDDKVRDYEDKAREAADKIKDSLTEVQDYLAGTDITSAARDFASAWIDAYKEFSSTTDAINEKFADMIQNMIVEGIGAELVRNILQPIYDSIGEAAKDGFIDAKEIADIANSVPGATQEINNAMTILMESLKNAGYDIRQQTTGLTGISKDIATASEESILGLAAGINTQNFYISQIHANVAAILSKMGGTPVASGGVDVKALVEIQNQHLAYLPVIAQHTADILVRCERAATACESMSRNIGRVIVPKGSQSSHQLSVTLN